MNYGLYLSANGMLASSFRQDVIANNLANVENVGFRRDVATFQQRLTEAAASRMRGKSNPVLENFSGGLLLSPMSVDLTQGELESTGNNLDVAIHGEGYFSVRADGKNYLTRDGRFAIDRDGFIVLANGSDNRVLDRALRPIQLDSAARAGVSIGENGEITQTGELVAQIGLFDVDNPDLLQKHGHSLLSYASDQFKPGAGVLRSGFLERANVDPATELAQLMDAQRQLEANANMIRYQDQALGRLVNDVGRIS